MLNKMVNIKNRGFNETIVRNNGKKQYSKMHWDGKYNGNEGELSLDVSKNGANKHIEVHFDNQDLAQLLNIPSVNMPLESRLKKDFFKNKTRKNYHSSNPIVIEFLKQPDSIHSDSNSDSHTYTYDDTSESDYLTHISSPEMDEAFLLPLTTIRKPRKKAPKKVTKRIYKVLRAPKSSKKTRSTR